MLFAIPWRIWLWRALSAYEWIWQQDRTHTGLDRTFRRGQIVPQKKRCSCCLCISEEADWSGRTARALRTSSSSRTELSGLRERVYHPDSYLGWCSFAAVWSVRCRDECEVMGVWVGDGLGLRKNRDRGLSIQDVARSSDNAACLGASWHNYWCYCGVNSVRHSFPDALHNESLEGSGTGLFQIPLVPVL